MKTVVIGGATRSGKSLLANAIYQTTKCTVVHMDQILGSVRKGHPEKFPKSRTPGYHALQAEWQTVVIHFIQNMGKEFDYDRVFECQFLDPEEIARELAGESYIPVFLGYPRIDPAAKVQQIRSADRDRRDRWHHDVTDEQLLEHVRFYIDLSDQHERKCRDVGVPYFDTSEDFDSTFAAAREHVLERLAKNHGEATPDGARECDRWPYRR